MAEWENGALAGQLNREDTARLRYSPLANIGEAGWGNW